MDIIPGFSIIDNAVNAIALLEQMKLLDYVLTYFFFSIIGWCIETTYCSLAAHKFINRGFLTGPLCPIYGAGGLIFSVALSRFADHWIVVLLLGVVLADIVEYLTSFIMEKLFHARWWDYSHEFMNIKGRICLKHTFYWGIASLAYIYIAQYYYLWLYLKIPQTVRYILLGVIFVIFILDLINAARNAMGVKSYMGKITSVSAALAELKNKFTGDKERLFGLAKQLDDLKPENYMSAQPDFSAEEKKKTNRMYRAYGNLHATAERSLKAAEDLLTEIKLHFTSDDEMY